MRRLIFIVSATLVAPLAWAAAPAATQPATTAAVAGTEPSTNPISQYFSRREERSSRGTSAYPVPRLTDTEYGVLEHRSIFYKGRFPDPTNARTEWTNPTTRYVPTAPAATPERSLVFEGATSFDDEYVAFIEDFNGGKVQMLKMGDGVGTGKVGIISLNSMDYIDKAGKTRHIALGKTLEGGDAPTTRPVFATTPDSASPTTSSTGGTNGVMESIAERLRRKRQAEGGS